MGNGKVIWFYTLQLTFLLYRADSNHDKIILQRELTQHLCLKEID